MITAALIGNPNCGKTALFNALTGQQQYVGNWAGVTVEKRKGYFPQTVKPSVLSTCPAFIRSIPTLSRKKSQKAILISSRPML